MNITKFSNNQKKDFSQGLDKPYSVLSFISDQQHVRQPEDTYYSWHDKTLIPKNTRISQKYTENILNIRNC